MRGEIKTTGQLRKFLVLAMEDVKAGMLDPDKASRITKLAGQVNESFYAEIKVARVRSQAGEAMPKMGQMLLGESEDKAD